MARLLTSCLFVALCMLFRQGSAFSCYQCAGSLFGPGCEAGGAEGLTGHAGECDGDLTMCSTISLTITRADGEVLPTEVSRQCAISHDNGCTTLIDDGETKVMCTQSCDTELCNDGAPPAPVTTTTTTTTVAPPTEPSPELITTTTEAPAVVTKKAPADGGSGAAGTTQASFLALFVLSALTVVLQF